MVADCHRCKSLWKCSKCNQGFSLQRTIMGSTVCVVTCSRGFTKKKVAGVDRCVPQRHTRATTTPPISTGKSNRTTTAIIMGTTTESTTKMATTTKPGRKLF